MQLTTDLLVKKWKPKKNTDRVSCGDSLYLLGKHNGYRSYLFRAQPTENGIKKDYWVTIGRPAENLGNTEVGGELSLSEARMAAMFLREAIKSGDYTVSQVKKVIDKRCKVMELNEALKNADKIKIDPVVQMHSYPTFDSRFQEWYQLNLKANRWTHKDSKKKPPTCYAHIKKKIGHLPITDIPRSLIKSTLQGMFMEVPDLAKQMRAFSEEIFEAALDDRLIDQNPTPPIKNFVKPKKKTKHHGTIKADRLPQLYQYILDSNAFASMKACAAALIVSSLRVSNMAYLRQENYDAKTGQFTIPAKSGENDPLGLMKSGEEYTNIFPDGLRKMINDQLIVGHEYVFVSPYGGRNVHPESVRPFFKGFDKTMTSHGVRNLFKEWAENSGVNRFMADRYVDHALEGLDAAYRRFDTLDARSEIARKYYDYMITGVTTEPEAAVFPFQ